MNEAAGERGGRSGGGGGSRGGGTLGDLPGPRGVRPLDRALLLLSILAIGASSAFFVATGVVGKGRWGEGSAFGTHDFVYFYAAGRCWLDGESPYPKEAFIRRSAAYLPVPEESLPRVLSSGFAYPPTTAAPFATLALLPFDGARIAFGVLNSAALLVIVLVLAQAAAADARVRASRWRVGVVGLVAALTIASPFASHNMWMGQTSMLIVAALCAAWWCFERSKTKLGAAGIGGGATAAIATIKPPLAIVYFVQMGLLERRFRAVAVAAAGCCLLVAPAVLVSGPIDAFREWFSAMAEYARAGQVRPEFRHSFGVRSVLATAGIQAPTLAPLALLVMAPAWFGRGFSSLERFALCLSAALLFVHGHDYDLVGVAPLAAALMMRAAGSAPALAAAVCATVILYIPLRFVTQFDVPMAGRWREVVVFIMTAALLWCGWRTGGADGRRADAAGGAVT